MYTSPMNTPLNFHKFFIFFIIPLNLLVGGFEIVQAMRSQSLLQTVFASQYIQSMLLTVFSVVLMIIIYIGVFRWRPYAWVCIMLQIGSTVLLSMIRTGTTILHYETLFNAPVMVGRYVLMALLWSLAFIYYVKRRRLFIGGAQAAPLPAAHEYEGYDSRMSRLYNKREKNLCPECGNILFRTDKECSKCGILLPDDVAMS